jgi:hypothetical protein
MRAAVREAWAPDLVKETYSEISPPDRQLDCILLTIQKSPWTLGNFLHVLFSSPMEGLFRSPKHGQMVSQFLQGCLTTCTKDIVELIYRSRDSAPKPV